ncbi:MAG: hypothetical protein KDF65_14680 [Anaerolineae bacterium]|nr:hypothetical protein [Anaerolineae bacterium]
MSPQPKTPKLGLLYLRGLAVYGYYRSLEALEAMRQRLLAPVRGLRRLVTALKDRWQRTDSRLVKLVALLVALTLLTGGAILLHRQRATLRAVATLIAARARHLWRHLRRPAVVIVTGQTEEIPVMPGLNSTERL